MTTTTTTTEAAAAYAARMIEAPYTIDDPADTIVRLIDGAYDLRNAVKITDAYGMTYHVEEISGRVSPNEMSNYRPDPDRPGYWTWDEVLYPVGTFRVFHYGECLAHIDAEGNKVG